MGLWLALFVDVFFSSMESGHLNLGDGVWRISSASGFQG